MVLLHADSQEGCREAGKAGASAEEEGQSWGRLFTENQSIKTHRN